MANRRVLSVSLPTSDPRSVMIEVWLVGLPAKADVSSEVRRLLALALDLRSPLARIEAQLAHLVAGESPAPVAPVDDPEAEAAMDRLFSFEV